MHAHGGWILIAVESQARLGDGIQPMGKEGGYGTVNLSTQPQYTGGGGRKNI